MSPGPNSARQSKRLGAVETATAELAAARARWEKAVADAVATGLSTRVIAAAANCSHQQVALVAAKVAS